MKISSTFAEIVEDSLYSITVLNDNENEFRKCFTRWRDPIYLREFFEKNINDLNDPYWNGINIDEAIVRTKNEANSFEEKILEVAENGKTNKNETLSSLFKPLSDSHLGEKYERNKAYGENKKTWIRLYALRLSVNFFIVCGGAIKLTRTMNNREHLTLELEKLKQLRNLLIEHDQNHIDDIGFYELK
ncbi:hypothetical protein MHM83_04635 [Tenacibaculum sp. Mcav3-52]|uniref:hypothetical protein n=1 Tax=Tenacibaculum sp. Mcav3-52 TaxID=2917762 RepID=UPI001EF1913D|nr:hypothetical protein [Tenacibaculum sp. Mcav3-52]MCG7501148.1 hypothetical protein [Tenacibaculum sp. Mcav3-52]